MGDDGDGLKPDEHIFDDSCIAELGDILSVDRKDNRLKAFQAALIEIGLQRRNEIRSSPMNYPKLSPFKATLNQRKKWLEKNTIAPAQRLLDALHEENAPYFSVWPDEATLKNIPDFHGLFDALAEFHRFSERLHECLDDLHSTEDERAEHTLEMSRVIVFDLLDLLREWFPRTKISRNPEGKERKNEGASTAQTFLRRAFLEITGKHAQLNTELQLYIDDVVNFRPPK